MESGQFYNTRIIGKNAHVSAIYLLIQVDYITFGVGYCLLLGKGSPEPQCSNISSSHASFLYNSQQGTLAIIILLIRNR